MKALIAIIALAITTFAASAADVVITVTDIQVKAVTRVAARMSAERVANLLAAHPGAVLSTNALVVTASIDAVAVGTTTLITALQYGKFICDTALDGIVRQERILIKQEVAAKYDEADASTQTTVNDALGVAP